MHLSIQVKFLQNFTVIINGYIQKFQLGKDFKPPPNPTTLCFIETKGFILILSNTKLHYCDTGTIASCSLFHIPVGCITCSTQNQAEVDTCPCTSVSSLTSQLRHMIEVTLYQCTHLPTYQQLLEELEKQNSANEYRSTDLLLQCFTAAVFP